jgi:hypothetical protein
MPWCRRYLSRTSSRGAAHTPSDTHVKGFSQVVADYLVHGSVKPFAEFRIQDYQI